MNRVRGKQPGSPRQIVASPRCNRRGSAAVELAIMAPLFVALVLGTIQCGMNLDMQIKLQASIRQAGRLAAMDSTKKLIGGQTPNQKVVQDIKNVLTAEGLPGDQATVTITHADGADAGSNFDISSSASDLQLFKIQVEIPYSALNANGLLPNAFTKLTASIVYRKEKIIAI